MTGDRIETAEERDALPVESVVRSAAGTIAARADREHGVCFGVAAYFPWVDLALPLSVLWRPDAPRPAAFTDSSCEHCPDVDALAKFLTGRAIPGGSGPDVILSPNQADHLARSLSMEFSSRAPVTDLRADIEALRAVVNAVRDLHDRLARERPYSLGSGYVTMLRDALNAKPGCDPWGLPCPEHGDQHWRDALTEAQEETDRLRAILAAHPTVEAVKDGAQPGCDGSDTCPAPAHVHGCYADLLGHCDEPGEHPTVESAGVALIVAEPHCPTCICGKRAPVQGSSSSVTRNRGSKPAGTVTWAEYLEAYEAYAARYGKSQSPERLAERAGFGYWEITDLLGHEPTTWSLR